MSFTIQRYILANVIHKWFLFPDVFVPCLP